MEVRSHSLHFLPCLRNETVIPSLFVTLVSSDSDPTMGSPVVPPSGAAPPGTAEQQHPSIAHPTTRIHCRQQSLEQCAVTGVATLRC